MKAIKTNAYRALPAVETLVQAAEQQLNGDHPPRELLVDSARAALDAARREIATGNAAPTLADLAARIAATTHAATQPLLRPVINASGVIIQTNLGARTVKRRCAPRDAHGGRGLFQSRI